jgi:cbb3-type cytochrome oxidase maturation protein
MTTLVYLIPVALFLGALGLAGFLWALRSGQYEDLDGAAQRILVEWEEDLHINRTLTERGIAKDFDPPGNDARRSLLVLPTN